MNQDFVIHSSTKDLGGFSVSRALPHVKKRSVGPFVFIDHMGPMNLDERQLLNVRPHPHIGLATVTYLLEGRGFHRDNIGSAQLIVPGDINLMIAGQGIVHSERTPEEDVKNYLGKTIHGLQIWIALPLEHEECEPQFYHYPKNLIPHRVLSDNLQVEVMMGAWQGMHSPVKTLSSTLFMFLTFKNKIQQDFSFDVEEAALMVVAGEASINGQQLKENDLIVVAEPGKVTVSVAEGAQVAVFGGAAFPEPRYIWWNFVSSSKERIHKAAQQWKNQEMPPVPGETEFIPLPDQPLP